MRRLRQINDELPGLVSGILLYGGLLQISAAVLGRRRLYDAVGLWVGIACAVYMGIHMAVMLKHFLGGETGSEDKKSKGRICPGMLPRYLVVIGVFALLVFSDLGNPILAFFGVMGLKVSAYLQPMLRKLYHGVLHADKREKGGKGE